MGGHKCVQVEHSAREGSASVPRDMLDLAVTDPCVLMIVELQMGEEFVIQ